MTEKAPLVPIASKGGWNTLTEERTIHSKILKKRKEDPLLFFNHAMFFQHNSKIKWDKVKRLGTQQILL